MIIIGLIEIDTGPSKLDENLEKLRVRGLIMLDPEQARDILFERLLADFRKNRGKNPAVEVLALIAGETDGLFDFTAILEAFKEREAEIQRIRQQIEAKGNINIVGPKTTQPEI